MVTGWEEDCVYLESQREYGIVVAGFSGWRQRQLEARERKYLQPHGQFKIEVVGADGKPTPARISVTDDDGNVFCTAGCVDQRS